MAGDFIIACSDCEKKGGIVGCADNVYTDDLAAFMLKHLRRGCLPMYFRFYDLEDSDGWGKFREED